MMTGERRVVPAAASELDLVSQVRDYAIIVLDPDGYITTWNAGAELVKGYRAEEIVGQHFSRFYPEADREAGLPQRLLAEAADQGRVEHVGWRLRKDGSLFWGDVVITALRDDDGELVGFGKVTRDLTTVKRLEQAQDSFYAAFEHDFRTPITSIKGFASLVRDAALNDEQRDEVLRRIEQNADRLLEMMSELVEYARLRSGVLPQHYEELDVTAVCREAVGVLAAVDTAQVTVSGSAAPVSADRSALQRIIVNLLTNAVKYSPPGSPVQVLIDQPDELTARVRVLDRGRGIKPQDLPHIFDEFERGGLADRRDGGAGIGLASVKQLVALQGGNVSLESEVGVGTTATVLIPVCLDLSGEVED